MPSVDTCSSTISGRRDRERSASAAAQLLGDLNICGEFGDAAHIEPVPELLRPHLRLALRHDAGRDQRLADLGAGKPDQRRLSQPPPPLREGPHGSRRAVRSSERVMVEADRIGSREASILPVDSMTAAPDITAPAR